MKLSFLSIISCSFPVLSLMLSLLGIFPSRPTEYPDFCPTTKRLCPPPPPPTARPGAKTCRVSSLMMGDASSSDSEFWLYGYGCVLCSLPSFSQCSSLPFLTTPAWLVLHSSQSCTLLLQHRTPTITIRSSILDLYLPYIHTYLSYPCRSLIWKPPPHFGTCQPATLTPMASALLSFLLSLPPSLLCPTTV